MTKKISNFIQHGLLGVITSYEKERGYILEKYKKYGWIFQKGHEIVFHPHLYSLKNKIETKLIQKNKKNNKGFI